MSVCVLNSSCLCGFAAAVQAQRLYIPPSEGASGLSLPALGELVEPGHDMMCPHVLQIAQLLTVKREKEISEKGTVLRDARKAER